MADNIISSGKLLGLPKSAGKTQNKFSILAVLPIHFSRQIGSSFSYLLDAQLAKIPIGLRRAGSVCPARLLVTVPKSRPGLVSGTKFHVPGSGSRAGAGREPGGSRAGAGHIFYFPGPGLPGLKFCWPGVGRLGYIARDLENPGYLGCSAYLNYISRNMQYLPIY